MNTDPYANPFVTAHIKHCRLCRKHDRVVAGTWKYASDAELERFKAHVKATIARIKLATEDAKLQAAHSRT